ncbi:Low-density lipoprotein receptor domain class A [Necator americanus]|uniref:Low-density lipoprotein receptor domain class A n=1 Tax=Necator americanus TaxID=51031 RepID=W2TGA6_NECAM|nr:Low-density lipoprotein receptor domain class A [Necator americanus]ETN80848.1 Low-density lipoprotein receptor domain class A [Necator americanus]
MEEAGLFKTTLGQFLGYGCSPEFYHCRWQSDGFRTYRKLCKTGLVYDVIGTQNCNYDYNVKSCGISGGVPATCNSTSFHCSLSEQCVPLSQRCDGRYDCSLEEDEQNCPLCAADDFACIVSEQCIGANRRCNGIAECSDGTDEMNCDGESHNVAVRRIFQRLGVVEVE